jgi:hypothetical protein
MINAVGLAYEGVLLIEYVALQTEQLTCEKPDKPFKPDILRIEA